MLWMHACIYCSTWWQSFSSSAQPSHIALTNPCNLAPWLDSFFNTRFCSQKQWNPQLSFFEFKQFYAQPKIIYILDRAINSVKLNVFNMFLLKTSQMCMHFENVFNRYFRNFIDFCTNFLELCTFVAPIETWKHVSCSLLIRKNTFTT